MYRRAPSAVLRPFVETLWVSGPANDATINNRFERVLPNGKSHMVFRLDGSPIRILSAADDEKGASFSSAIIAGVRTTPYFKRTEKASSSVGVVLKPNVPAWLTGHTASEFTDNHTSLDLLWGSSAVAEIEDRLHQAQNPESKLVVIEQVLTRRLSHINDNHEKLVFALNKMHTHDNVADIVAASGISHRSFIKAFKAVIGMTPKRYHRVVRFNRLLEIHKYKPEASWADLAYDAGFSDQAHLTREFGIHAGITPREYKTLSVQTTHHLPS